jgi:hypothetical protein
MYSRIYTRWLLLFAVLINIVFCIVAAKALWKQKSSSTLDKQILPNICALNAKYHAAKPFFDFVCHTNLLDFFDTSNHSEKHICDRLYSSHIEPNLFSRLHAELKLFNKRKVLSADIENISASCRTCHHVQIIGNQLYNVPRPAAFNTQTRSRSVKISIKHVLDIFPDIPDLDLFFSVGDVVDLGDKLNNALFDVPIFAITKTNKIKWGLRPDRIVLMPCFTLWSWPEPLVGRWPKRFQSILNAGQKLEYENRVPKLFWRGFEFPKRSWFIKVAKKHPGTMDLEVNVFKAGKGILALAPSTTYKTLEQHCNYKYLLHQEGYTYSSRLKYILLCGSTVVFNVID